MENRDPEHEFRRKRLHSSNKIPPKSLSLKNKLIIQKRDDQSSVRESDDTVNSSKQIKHIAVAGNSASTFGYNEWNDIVLSENSDSLCDFRSPVKESEMNESLADFRVKPTVLKSDKHLARKQSKPVVKKKRCNRDITSNVNQPSIESSFFRPQTAVKTAFLCPLCFKSYKDVAAQHAHMKSCATKNKISTHKLLDAVELQEKQANERRAMGLLAAPQIQPKKTISKKLISEKDPHLQLALALSMSLHEAQVTEELEEAHLLVGEPCLPPNTEMTEERRKTLQNFGFTTNKLMTASTSGKSRKKRPLGPTLLQTRTQEERDRFITVRIAEVLMGDEAITQALLKDVEKVIKSEENIILKSRLLRSYHCVEGRLWDKTQKCLTDSSSYSCNLPGLSPCKMKPEPELKQPEPGSSKLKTLNQGTNNAPDTIDGGNIFTPVKLESASRSPIIENKKTTAVKHKTDENSAMNLSTDWRCMLDASYMSDVLVIVKQDVQIYAHQIVFWARCSDILRDMTTDNPKRLMGMQQKILWPETDALSAEAFLEYVYCGVIEKYVSVFDYPDILAGVRVLARKYRLIKLFAYLRDKLNELKLNKVQISNHHLSKTKINLKSKLTGPSVNNSSSHGEDENSVSSVETDMNLRSTVCDEATSNHPDINQGTSYSDKNQSENCNSVNVQEKGNISHRLVVDCFSSSNDSYAMQIPATSMSTETACGKLLDGQMSQRISVNSITAFGDGIHKSDNNIKLIDETLEEERCTSPDIFDDCTTGNSTCTYTVLDKLPSDLEQNAKGSNTDVGVICLSNKHLRVKSPDLNDECDKMIDTSEQNIFSKSEKAEADFTFVSTRRRRKSLKLLSDDVHLDSECANLNQKKHVFGSVLKQKGDITIAIEKIQRLNAKTGSESDSECESLETFSIKKHKNPFRINVTDSSSMIEEIVKDDIYSGSENKIPLKKKNALSIFEKQIELEAVKNPAMFNLITHKPVSNVYSKEKGCTDSFNSKASFSEPRNVKLDQQQSKVDNENRIEPSQRGSSKLNDTVDDVLDLTQDSSRESKLDSDEDICNTVIEDQDLSMFAKYKRKRSHNSIDKYRAALKNISSRTTASGIEDTDDPVSSDDLQSSNDELLDVNSKMNRNSPSSKYEYTDPDQSASNLHRKLSNVFSKDKEPMKISHQNLSSTQTGNRELSNIKLDDAELSDLEIDLSDFSRVISPNQLGDNRVNSKSQGTSAPKRRTDGRISNDKQMPNDTCEGIDSFSDIRLEDTEFTIMKNDSRTRRITISDQDTNIECCIEPSQNSKQPNHVDKIKRQSDVGEDNSSDIYNEETDTGGMEDKHYELSNSRSKIKVAAKLDILSRKIPKTRHQNENRCETSSPDCEISAIFSPPSMNFDFVTNISNEVENLLGECKNSQVLRSVPPMNPAYSNSPPTTSNSNLLPFTSHITGDDIYNTHSLNEISDSEFDDMEFTVNMKSSANNCKDEKLAGSKSMGVEKERKTMNRKMDKKYVILESDSSDREDFKIRNSKSSAASSIISRSETIIKPLIQSQCETITPKRSPKFCRRTLRVKSVSENIIKTKSTSGADLMDDSFGSKLVRVRTPPIQQQSTSSNYHQTTPQQEPPSENVTPLANYSAMKTPELRKELQKYGLKAQKRHRAKQLLRHIYNELHPLVPIADENIPSHSNESSSEDDRPAPKRLNRSRSLEAINYRKNTDNIDSDCETLASDTSTVSDTSNEIEGLENGEFHTLSQSDNIESLENAFRMLIQVDTSLHNKILAYEPLMLEELHSTLKAQGFKFNLNALMDFLDEQCITFRTLANGKSRRKQKASPKKNQGVQ